MKMVPFVIPENLKVPDWFQNIFIHLQKEHTSCFLSPVAREGAGF